MHSSLTLPAGRDAGLRCARADRLFVDGGKWLMLALLVLAVLLPLTAMLWRGFAGEPGQGGNVVVVPLLRVVQPDMSITNMRSGSTRRCAARPGSSHHST